MPLADSVLACFPAVSTCAHLYLIGMADSVLEEEKATHKIMASTTS